MARYGGKGIRDAGKKAAPYRLKPGEAASGTAAGKSAPLFGGKKPAKGKKKP